MREAGVVIVGAGPAGATCGYLLKKARIDCVVVDHSVFPRDKICGGGLTPKAYLLLEELVPGLEYPYQGVSHGKFMIDGKVICELDTDRELRVVCRKDFDNRLLGRYLSVGGELVKGSFDSYRHQDGKILVRLKSGEEMACDYLVGADGANSRVRKAMSGNYSGNTLWMEQYTEKQEDEFVFDSFKDCRQGYYFHFPGIGRDVVGAGGAGFRIPDFGELLSKKGIAETKFHGAYIPVETVVSDDDRVMLIGDAGGFVNKISFEGLYYAFATARNASKAIICGKSFRETNREIFRKKRKEKCLARIFYSRFGFFLVRVGAHSPGLIKRVFERYI